MRILAAYIAACLAVAGCAPPNSATTAATSADTLTFSNAPSYAPNPPIDGTQVTITWTVTNNSTNNTAVNFIPYVINRDKAYNSQSTISTIGPGATATFTFMIQESDGLSHTYEAVLDPNNTTGAINTSTNTQSIVVPWQPLSSG
jgi:hypothetical protein